MTHDIEDLLNLIKELEARILLLEEKQADHRVAILSDAWYWEHG